MELYFNIGDFYALMAALCWSSGVILFELSGKSLDSIQINLLKNSIGFLCFVVVLLVTGDLFISYTNQEYGILVISAILGVAIGDLLLLNSLRRLGAGLYAIVGTSYVLFVFIFALVMYQEQISHQIYFGGSLVIMGIIVRSNTMLHSIKRDVLLSGILYGLFAQILTAYSVLLIKPIMENHYIVHIAMLRFGIGMLFNIGHFLFSKGMRTFIETIVQGISNPTMVIGSLMGTFLSVIFWLSGFKYTLASRAAIYNQLSTILITLMAAIFLKEKMTYKSWFGVMLAFIGAMIVSMS
jgi:drug/metabolite transporter (DMT)-like permease